MYSAVVTIPNLIYNNSYGGIKWINDTNGGFLKDMDLTGNIGVGINLSIGNNTAYLNAGAFTSGLINSSANITLYGMDSFSFSSPVILKDGVECTNDECYNFTALNSTTVLFNVTYAGANSSLGEGVDTESHTINCTSTLPDHGTSQLEDHVYVNVTTNATNEHYALIDCDR